MSFDNPFIQTLTGISTGSFDYLSLIIQDEDEGKQSIVDVKDYFLRYQNIETLQHELIPIGGGLYDDNYYFNNSDKDTQIVGLKSLLEYLNHNYRKNDDDSIIYKTYHIFIANIKRNLFIDNSNHFISVKKQ